MVWRDSNLMAIDTGSGHWELIKHVQVALTCRWSYEDNYALVGIVSVNFRFPHTYAGLMGVTWKFLTRHHGLARITTRPNFTTISIYPSFHHSLAGQCWPASVPEWTNIKWMLRFGFSILGTQTCFSRKVSIQTFFTSTIIIGMEADGKIPWDETANSNKV